MLDKKVWNPTVTIISNFQFCPLYWGKTIRKTANFFIKMGSLKR